MQRRQCWEHWARAFSPCFFRFWICLFGIHLSQVTPFLWSGSRRDAKIILQTLQPIPSPPSHLLYITHFPNQYFPKSPSAGYQKMRDSARAPKPAIMTPTGRLSIVAPLLPCFFHGNRIRVVASAFPTLLLLPCVGWHGPSSWER